MKKVRQFTIKRSEWLHFGNNTFSCLKDNSGNKCCLGFYAEALGNPARINSYHTAGNPAVIDAEWPKWLVLNGENTDKCLMLIDVNDKFYSRDRDRERRIKQLFAQNGVLVKFVD